jgi:adenylate cyclase
MTGKDNHIDSPGLLWLEKTVEDMMGEPYLVVHTSKGTGCLELTDKNYWTIGRGRDNVLVVPDNCISRNHAILQLTENGLFYLIDLGSRNGTFINGRRVSIPIILRDGDTITFGKTQLEFHVPNSSAKQGKSDSQKKTLIGDRDTQTSAMLERRLMSVMVIDIRNYTVLARQIGEKRLSEMIGYWFRESGQIIRDSGSWIDKYIGDAVMAVWLHNRSEISSKELFSIFWAVYQISQLTNTLTQQYDLPFKLTAGAGINTGYAMIGNTGSDDNPDFTAIGDTVNTAFRLESATKEVGVDLAVGETTYEHLNKLISQEDFFQEYSVQLRGYEKPITMFGINFSNFNELILSQANIQKN